MGGTEGTPDWNEETLFMRTCNCRNDHTRAGRFSLELWVWVAYWAHRSIDTREVQGSMPDRVKPTAMK